MRVLVVTSSYPRTSGDHAGRFVFDLNRAFVARGHRVTTLAPDSAPGDGAVPEGGPLPADAGRVEHVGPESALFYGAGMEANASQRGAFATLRALRRAAPAWRAAIARAAADADLVLAHWLFPAGAWTSEALAGVRLPVASIAHGGDVHLLGRPLVGRWLASVLRMRPARWIATSTAAAAIVARRMRLPESDVLVRPMGVDTTVFTRDPRPASTVGAVVAAGRLDPIKGFDVLVRACARLDAPLVIAGDGPERARLVRLARAEGVALTLEGLLPAPALARLFRSAAVVVVPSRRLRSGRVEGCPVVALEALCCGAAVVGTDTGGLPDVLPPQALAPPDDPDTLAMLIAAARAEPARFTVADAAARHGVGTVADLILRHAMAPAAL